MTIDVCTDALTTSNCYVLGDGGGALVIDPNDCERILEMTSGRGLEVELIVLTHEHCDHISGLEELRAATGARVLASAACSSGIGSITQNVSRIMEVYLYFLHGREIPYAPFTCRPADVTYDKDSSFKWRSLDVRCVPLPGHSPGSALVMIGDDIFSGDYLLPDEKVVTRLPGGSASDYERIAVPFLESLPLGSTVHPGHGASYVLTEEVMKKHGS